MRRAQRDRRSTSGFFRARNFLSNTPARMLHADGGARESCHIFSLFFFERLMQKFNSVINFLILYFCVSLSFTLCNVNIDLANAITSNKRSF